MAEPRSHARPLRRLRVKLFARKKGMSMTNLFTRETAAEERAALEAEGWEVEITPEDRPPASALRP